MCRVNGANRLSEGMLDALLQNRAIEDLDVEDIAELVRQEIHEKGYLPDKIVQVDPRSGERILYHSARAKREHDNLPKGVDASQPSPPCLICEGRTTGIVDLAQLSEGFTFINKNLYPVLYPFEDGTTRQDSSALFDPSSDASNPAWGMHFLQWTSSFHGRDWHNMPLADLVVVMRRLAALEKKLLTREFSDRKENGSGAWAGETEQRHVLIIKNFGHLVGGSLSHGHQQIAYSNTIPGRFLDDLRFEENHGEKFAEMLLRQNPDELTVKDYGTALLLVPYFMRRPYDLMLLLKNTRRRHLHDLSDDEIAAVSRAWHDVIKAFRSLMPGLNKETAYNVITHNGPGAGLYFEFLPYTQETGGFEHLGLIVCQENPSQAALRLREMMK